LRREEFELDDPGHEQLRRTVETKLTDGTCALGVGSVS